MGGHGGLNILPQKRWNVYNFDNREKVKNDEEAAAKEEQLKREQSRKRDAEYRLEQLRTARGLAPTIQPSAASSSVAAPAPPVSEPASASPPASESKHINLFEGIKVFDIMDDGVRNGERGIEKDGHKKKKMKKEEPAPRVVTEEDEKYKLGYGVAGKGVKLPWYLAKPSDNKNDGKAGDNDASRSGKERSKSGGKKTIEELREERIRIEKRVKERTRALIHDKGLRDVPLAKDRYFSRPTMLPNVARVQHQVLLLYWGKKRNNQSRDASQIQSQTTQFPINILKQPMHLRSPKNQMC